MFPIPLRSSKSERNLHKLKKGKSPLSWSLKSSKSHLVPRPELDLAAFHNGLPQVNSDDRVSLDTSVSVRQSRCISARNVKRDTIFIDLTNNDLIPALDYAFAIIDADNISTRSLPSPLSTKALSADSSNSGSFDMSFTPTSVASSTPSVRSAPPRYVYVSSPLSSSSSPSALPTARLSPQKHNETSELSRRDDAFDPHELSRALTHTQSDATVERPSPSPGYQTPCIPFPPPAKSSSTARVPLLQRKPRLLHSPESSLDGHDCFMSRSYPSSSKVSLARSVSSLDHHRDFFGLRGACPSSTSINTIDSGLAALLTRHSTSHGTSSSMKLFSSPRKTRPGPFRRASTPPPSRTRHGVPSSRPPVPALPDLFLLGPAARREAVSDSNSLLSRLHM